MQNSLLILTSCLFISFNTQDVTFRCAAAVSRSDAGGSDVSTGLRSEVPKQKLGRKPLKKKKGDTYDTLTSEISEDMLKTGPERRIKSVCDSDTIRDDLL